MLLKCPQNAVRAAVVVPKVDTRPAQILTVNVEDYFQAGVFHQFVESRNWYRFDSRLEKNVEETLAVLEQYQTTATFFVLGWIADRHRELVRRIAKAGHEIASRGYLHQPLLQLNRQQRREDLMRSRRVLEDITGTRVAGFRLSDGWLSNKDLPFLEEVQEAGYLYDSSLLPRRRQFLTDPSRRFIHQYQFADGPLIEIPLATLAVAGSWLPIAGGNYQRQLPHWLMHSAVDRWTSTESAPYVMYFQVWEMDDEQPKMSAFSRLTKIRHYRNLGIYRGLLPSYLQTWRFTSVRDHATVPNSPLASLANAAEQMARRDVHSQASHIEPLSVSERRSTASDESALQFATIAPNWSALPTTTTSDSRPVDPSDQSTVSRYHRAAARTGVTLVIPCYNEEGSLPYLARTLEHVQNSLSADYDLKVLFVDDCSRDQTRDVLQQLFGSEDHVRILHHKTNQGVSAAILTGLRNASTDIACTSL